VDKVAEFDKKFEDTIAKVDSKLATAYKNVRRKYGKDPKDVVVPVVDKRCGGCYMDLPLNQLSQIKVNGYVLCEECGKINYAND